ncbi:GyrI-like domain-containing protein [Ornithinibacillus xuwenensis]|uniref:Effector binding domain-containing protein n=1 Tax=Ornithinibacillus xuwenensis TaxID=3144668 RepID=A0ABU9XFD8_9BACI
MEVISLIPKIIKRDSFQLVGYHLFTNLKEMEETSITDDTVSRLTNVAPKIENRLGDHIYFLQIYPMMEQFNPFQDKYSQMIGYEVENAEHIPEDTMIYTVEENMYVCCKHTGPRTEIYNTYDYLYNTWMIENRCIPLGYDMEVWNHTHTTDSEVEIYIAINKI